jgi:hypothetical protein
MIAIGIGIFFFIQTLVLIFAFTMCKSAALADREFERARNSGQRTTSRTSEWIENKKEHQISPDTKPVTRFGTSNAHS